VYQCDRCKAVIAESWGCTQVRGSDLCGACVASLDAWLAAGALKLSPAQGKTKAQRNAPEDSMAVVRVIAQAQGKVSAQALADATGEPYRAAYLRLRHLHRKGLIERVAGCVYRLPSLAMEAAE
jgi:hypothetical protein